MKTPRRKKIVKAAFFGGVLLVWAALGCVALEFFLRMHDFGHWKNNPYVQSVLGQRNFPEHPQPSPFAAAAPLSQANGAAIEDACRVWKIKRQDIPAWHLLHRNESREAQRARREAFAALAKTDQDDSCRIHGETVLSYGRNGAVTSVQGPHEPGYLFAYIEDSVTGFIVRHTLLSGMFERFAHAEALCRATRAPESFAVSFPSPLELPALLGETYPADDRGTRMFLTVDFDGFHQKTLPADSPWEIPFQFYKPNLPPSKMRNGLATNSLGLCDRERAIPKPAGVFRIVCIGGSTTEMGPNIEGTYPARLEKLLAERYPGKTIEVINGGCSGAYSYVHFARMETYLRLEPDLVIGYLEPNDVIWNAARWRIYGPWLLAARYSMALRRLLLYLPREREDELMEYHRELSIENEHLLAGLFREQGIPAVLCSVAAPALNRLEPLQEQFLDYSLYSQWKQPCMTYADYARLLTKHNGMVRQLCEEHGYFFADIAARANGGFDVFNDPCHFNFDAIPLFAVAMAEEIAPLLDALLNTGAASALP